MGKAENAARWTYFQQLDIGAHLGNLFVVCQDHVLSQGRRAWSGPYLLDVDDDLGGISTNKVGLE